MATQLSPLGAREVVKCDFCFLVQFPTRDSNCRRCHVSYDYKEPQPPAAETLPAPVVPRDLPTELAAAVRSLRLRAGLSQRQLAARMAVPRTFVSKIETRKCCPTMRTFFKLLGALQCTIPDLLGDRDRIREGQITELLRDEFVSMLAQYVPKLSELNMREVLAAVNGMLTRPRSAA